MGTEICRLRRVTSILVFWPKWCSEMATDTERCLQFFCKIEKLNIFRLICTIRISYFWGFWFCLDEKEWKVVALRYWIKILIFFEKEERMKSFNAPMFEKKIDLIRFCMEIDFIRSFHFSLALHYVISKAQCTEYNQPSGVRSAAIANTFVIVFFLVTFLRKSFVHRVFTKSA